MSDTPDKNAAKRPVDVAAAPGDDAPERPAHVAPPAQETETPPPAANADTTPADTATENSTTTEAPGEKPAVAPAEAHAQSPAHVPAEAPPDVPPAVPPAVPADIPAHAPASAPASPPASPPADAARQAGQENTQQDHVQDEQAAEASETSKPAEAAPDTPEAATAGATDDATPPAVSDAPLEPVKPVEPDMPDMPDMSVAPSRDGTHAIAHDTPDETAPSPDNKPDTEPHGNAPAAAEGAPAAPAPAAATSSPPPGSAPPSGASRIFRVLLRLLAALLLLALLAGGYAAYDAWRFLNTPGATPGADVYVDVEPGATMDKVTRQLVARNAVTSDWRFKLLARYHDWQDSLKVGRFLVHSGWTPYRILDQLVNGQPVLSRVTLREGLTWWETARVLEAEGFVTVEDFRAVITDPAFLRHYGIPFDSAEGFLFPETYLIKKPQTPDRESARAVAGRLVDTFWRKAAQAWPEGRPQRDELRRLVILASIVEKETGQPSERGRVAGVYANRLRTGMLLQADPTTIYGLGESFDGNLRRSHLNDAANPYNTYRRPGLPPGPICSPGAEALRAATTPDKHGFFYFVSRNDGSHQFSTTLDEHNRAVNRYQRGGRTGNSGAAGTAAQNAPAPQARAGAEQPGTASPADIPGDRSSAAEKPPSAAEKHEDATATPAAVPSGASSAKGAALPDAAPASTTRPPSANATAPKGGTPRTDAQDAETSAPAVRAPAAPRPADTQPEQVAPSGSAAPQAPPAATGEPEPRP